MASFFSWGLCMRFRPLLLLVFLCFIGCAKKSEVIPVKLNLGLSHLLEAGSEFQGGVYIRGHSLDDEENLSIALFIDGTTESEVDLKTGSWEFVAVGWTGAGNSSQIAKNMRGQVKCAYVAHEVNPENAAIELVLGAEDCQNSFGVDGDIFSTAESMSNGTFNEVVVASCYGIEAANFAPSSSDCVQALSGGETNLGLTKSYQMILPGLLKREYGQIVENVPGISSACISISNRSGLKIPSGRNTAGGSGIFEVWIKSYTSTDCSGGPVIYSFDELSRNVDNLNKQSFFDAQSEVDSEVSVVYLQHNEETSTGIDLTFGAGGITKTLSTVEIISQNHYASIAGVDNPVLAPRLLNLGLYTGSEIHQFDEVAVYTNLGSGCGDSAYKAGRYRFSRVLSRDASHVQLEKSLKDLFGADKFPDFTHPDCSFQLVKVLSFGTFDLKTGGELSAPVFNGVGAVIMMKVAQQFIFNGGTLNVEDKSYTSDVSGLSACLPVEEKNCAPIGNSGFGGGAVVLNAKEFSVVDNTSLIKMGTSNAGGAGTIRLTGATKTGAGAIQIDNSTPGNIGATVLEVCDLTHIDQFVGGFAASPNALRQSCPLP